MEIFISLGQWWANIISAAVSVINSACMWISLEDNASTEWPCCELSLVVLWWAQRFTGAQVKEEWELPATWPLRRENLIISRMLCSTSSFICKTEAGLAMAQAARTGILFSSVQGAGNERESEQKGRVRLAGRKAVGKERRLTYEWGGCISIQPRCHLCNSVCVAHVTAITCRLEEDRKISQVSQK